MSSELTLWDQPVSLVQTTFNWDETFAETKKLVEEDAELTATIDDAMVKRFHGRVKIGFNLMALQKEHSKNRYGNFTTQVLPELGIDPRFSQRCISVARLYQNSIATRGSRLEDLFDIPLPIRTWENLASPSGQTVVKQLESGEIQPTQDAIKKALEEEKAKVAAEKQRAEQLKQELEAEQKAYSLFKQEVEANEQAYTALVQSLEQQLQKKAEPEKVIEYQDTLETVSKMAELKTLIEAHEIKIHELEAKPDIPPKIKQELDKLHLDLKNAQTELDFYTAQNEALAKEINEHREAAGRSLEDATALAGRLRIRQVWQYATDEIQAAIRKFHTRIPSEIDRESFENEEHTRTHQTIEILEQTATLLKKSLLQSDSTVDADISTTAIVQHQPAIPGPTIVIGIPPEYQALFDEYQRTVLKLPEIFMIPWNTSEPGYTEQAMTGKKHIQFTKELLSSRVERRIRAATDAMKRAITHIEVNNYA